MEYGNDTNNFKKCMRNGNTSESVNERMTSCLRELREACLRAKVVLVKTIRTPMTMALSLMTELKDLKIIHLIRDPRSTMNSRVFIHGCESGVKQCVEEHCSAVMEDSAAKGSARVYGDNIFTVKYEDLVRTPVTVTQQMYQFLKLKCSPAVEYFAFNITVGGDRRQCTLCRSYWQLGNTTESSLIRVDSWKQQMSPNLISLIEKRCMSVLDMYKYS